MGMETHLVMSPAAELTREYESDLSRDAVHALAGSSDCSCGRLYASGPFRTLGMLIAPCSMRTVGEVATGVTSTLLTGAAHEVLKERLPLAMMVRETPLNLIHLR